MQTRNWKYHRNSFIIFKKLALFYILLFIISCSDNNSIKEAIAPCEDAFNKELTPIKQLASDDFFNAYLSDGFRTSDKYLVTSGNITRNYRYLVINHQAQTYKFIERPYFLPNFLSDCKLYQIENDHLYLARLDRTIGWMLEAIHLESLDSEVIPIMLGNEQPKEILQVEKHENEIYILAEFDQGNVIFSYAISSKTVKVIYTPSDKFYTMGFKVLQYDQNNNYLIRAAIDSTNAKTIIEGVNLATQTPFYTTTQEGLLRKYNYPYNKEILPFDSNDRLYLNFIDSKSTIIEAKTGSIISTSPKQVLPLSSDYALSFYRNGADIDPAEFDIINPNTGESLIDAKWAKKFYRAEMLNQKYLLIDDFYDCKVLNLETKCTEYKNFGTYYKTNENEYIIINSEGLNFYKL